MQFDLFISYASEDRASIVKPLADGLRSRGYILWYDEFELKVGDSLRERIDHGLSASRAGLVILSPHFIRKEWPKRELAGLTSRQLYEGSLLIPVWHELSLDELLRFSPPLADIKALSSADGIERMVAEVARAIPPSNNEVEQSTIELAVEHLEQGHVDAAYAVAIAVLEKRSAALLDQQVRLGTIGRWKERALIDSRMSLEALLAWGKLSTRDTSGDIDVLMLCMHFEQFSKLLTAEDAEERIRFITESRRFVRANRLIEATRA